MSHETSFQKYRGHIPSPYLFTFNLSVLHSRSRQSNIAIISKSLWPQINFLFFPPFWSLRSCQRKEHVYWSPVSVKLVFIPLFYFIGPCPMNHALYIIGFKNVFDDKEMESKSNTEKEWCRIIFFYLNQLKLLNPLEDIIASCLPIWDYCCVVSPQMGYHPEKPWGGREGIQIAGIQTPALWLCTNCLNHL